MVHQRRFTSSRTDDRRGPNGNFHNQNLHFRWIVPSRHRIKSVIGMPKPTVSNVRNVRKTRRLRSACN